MRIFDYNFLKDISVPASLIGTARGIGRIVERTKILMDEHPRVFTELERDARFLSVKGSNAIEGIRTSDERLSSLMDRSVEPVGHDEAEIAGYRDALELIHENHSSMKITEETILELHRILMSHTAEGGGAYKKTDNVIVAVDGSGRRYVHFRPLSAKETPEAMEQAVLAYIDAEQNGVEPLLLIPCFILDFLSIHPFTDGNGRMSRLLTLLLLYRHGLDIGRYISVEERIDRTKSRYYASLSESSRGWAEGKNDYMPFTSYSLDVILSCYRSLDRCFATISGKKATKNNRVEAVVMSSLFPISKRDILSMLPDVSQTTVEACLHRMVESGLIEKIGGNRNARYRRKHQS